MTNTYLTEKERGVLSAARVGVAGAGGLGSNAAAHLVRAGVRRIVMADFDAVSESNLNRQFYFRDQIGRPKVEALAENLRRIEPDLELASHCVRLDETNMPAIFAGCDVVIEAFDKAESKTAFLRADFGGIPRVCASGIAGWGRSAAIGVRRFGRTLWIVGDGESDINRGLAPQSARVGIAAAMQANVALSLLLGAEP